MVDEVFPVEIVRLPISPDVDEAVLDLLRSHPYFAQRGLVDSRILVSEDRTEVVLVLDWADHRAQKRALESDHGRALLEGLGKLVTGAPGIVNYGAPA